MIKDRMPSLKERIITINHRPFATVDDAFLIIENCNNHKLGKRGYKGVKDQGKIDRRVTFRRNAVRTAAKGHGRSPAEARTIAHLLLECAEAAETDGFLWKYFTRVIGANEQQAARILLQYRAEREQGRE